MWNHRQCRNTFLFPPSQDDRLVANLPPWLIAVLPGLLQSISPSTELEQRPNWNSRAPELATKPSLTNGQLSRLISVVARMVRMCFFTSLSTLRRPVLPQSRGPRSIGGQEQRSVHGHDHNEADTTAIQGSSTERRCEARLARCAELLCQGELLQT